MRAGSIRMPDELWDMVTDEATRAGMSVSEFIRLSLCSSAMYRRGQRGHPYGETLERLGLLEDDGS